MEGVLDLQGLFGWMVYVRWHPHECQDPEFHSRILHNSNMVSGHKVETDEWSGYLLRACTKQLKSHYLMIDGEIKPVCVFNLTPLQCFDLQQSFSCADLSLCFSLAALRFRLREIEDVILPKKCKGAGIKINPAQETLRCKRQMTSCDQGKRAEDFGMGRAE